MNGYEGGHHYYDRDGQPIDSQRWAQLFEDENYRRIAYNEIGNVTVSTVWLGLDHEYQNLFGEQRPPQIFETMSFGLGHDVHIRYAIEKLARAGHADIVAKITAIAGAIAPAPIEDLLGE